MVSLVGEDPATTEITWISNVVGVSGPAVGSVVRNFTLRPPSSVGFGIRLSAVGSKAYNNVVVGGSYGIHCNAQSGSVEFAHNTVVGSRYGLYDSYGNSLYRLQNNVFAYGTDGAYFNPSYAAVQPAERGGNVSWGNSASDWSGYSPAASDKSADPKFASYPAYSTSS